MSWKARQTAVAQTRDNDSAIVVNGDGTPYIRVNNGPLANRLVDRHRFLIAERTSFKNGIYLFR